MINLTTTIAQNKEIIASNLDDEVIMMNLESNSYYTTDPVGTHIWELLKQPTTVRDICTSLQVDFDIDLETCQNEVLTFAQQLIDEKLLHIVQT